MQAATAACAVLSGTFGVLPELTGHLIALIATLGNAVVLLALPEQYAEMRWLFVTGRRPEWMVRGAAVAAALVLYLAIVGVGLVVPGVVLGLTAAAVGTVLLVALCVGAVALVAGALVPWSRVNAAQQALSAGLLLALLIALYAVGTRVLPAAAGAGVPDVVLAVAGPLLLVAGCATVALRGLGRREAVR